MSRRPWKTYPTPTGTTPDVGMLAATDGLLTLLGHGPWLVFTFCFGASVGSFVNVIVYRLPLHMSLSVPPSRCPTCGGKLRFFRENLPVLGWVLLRGRCRFCRVRISPVYPLVELIMGLLFVGLYVLLFMAGPGDWGWALGGPWWEVQQFGLAWPGYLAFATLLASLWAMTVIDARTFLIPIQIPLFASIAGMVLWTVQGLLARKIGHDWPLPATAWPATLAALLGLGGVLVSWALLATGRLRPSFADYEAFVPEGKTLGDYPHARREMGVELLFLLPCVAGIALGWWWGSTIAGVPPVWLQALGASVLGYLVGGGVVWAIRIFGTLGFGREAMGMGDVHLLAAVGAVTGWFLPLVAFFIAPFLGLAWAGIAGLIRRVDGRRRELPYGPHLAIAVVAVFLCRPLLLDGWTFLMPQVPVPSRTLATPESRSGPVSGWTPASEHGPMPVARDGDRAATQTPERRLNRWL